MRKWLLGLAAVMVLLFSSCEVFSNSWGENLARDPSTIKVTAGNVKDLLREAKGDTKTSRGILDKIAQELDGNPNPNPTMQAAAVTAANQASGLGMVILDNTDILLGDDIPDEETFKALLEAVQQSTKGNDLLGIRKDVADALQTNTARGAPEFTHDFEASAADLTLLALTLALAEAEAVEGESKDFNDYIKSWTNGSKNISTAEGLSDSEVVIAAITNKVTKDENSELGKMLKDLLEGN